jgi:hypothetical protein
MDTPRPSPSPSPAISLLASLGRAPAVRCLPPLAARRVALALRRGAPAEDALRDELAPHLRPGHTGYGASTALGGCGTGLQRGTCKEKVRQCGVSGPIIVIIVIIIIIIVIVIVIVIVIIIIIIIIVVVVVVVIVIVIIVIVNIRGWGDQREPRSDLEQLLGGRAPRLGLLAARERGGGALRVLPRTQRPTREVERPLRLRQQRRPLRQLPPPTPPRAARQAPPPAPTALAKRPG